MAQNLKQQGMDKLDASSLAAGVADVVNDKELKMDLEQCNQIVQTYMQAQAGKEYADNKQAGVDFLAENKKRPEVKTTDSGLQYEVLTEGTGASPKATDKVTVHYHGTLIDGTVFDSSVERGEPATFPLNGVITGWTEGLQLMKEGSKYRFFIPSNLGYGDRAAGPKIQPFSTLIFDVELINVQ